MNAGMEIVRAEDFALAELEEAREIIRANMEGITPEFPRIRIPAGGATTFEVPTGDGDTEPAKRLVGVIIERYQVNAYWREAFSGQGNPPDCSSLDGMTGEGDPGGRCATCPNNRWGSDPKGGRGKACKNIFRVYLLRPGELMPYLIALPPTSIKPFSAYMQRLSSKKGQIRPYWSVLTEISLEQVTNRDGIKYAQARFAKVGELSREQAAEIRKYADSLRAQIRRQAVGAEEYEVEDGSEPF